MNTLFKFIIMLAALAAVKSPVAPINGSLSQQHQASMIVHRHGLIQKDHAYRRIVIQQAKLIMSLNLVERVADSRHMAYKGWLKNSLAEARQCKYLYAEVQSNFLIAVTILSIIAYLVFLCVATLVYSHFKAWVIKMKHERTQPQVFYEHEDHSFVKGSEYINEKSPKWQFQIWLETDDKTQYTYLGTGSYVNEYFITAAHIANSSDGTYVWLCKQKEEQGIKVKLAWNCLDIDVAYMKADNQIASTLQLSKIKSGILLAKQIVEIRACGQKTIGTLRSSENTYGTTVYEGSSRRGFSGATYYVGSRALGMHVGCQKYGIGYEMSYIMCLIQQQTKEVKHDTTDWLFNAILEDFQTKGYKTRYAHSPSNPDEIMVRRDAEYYVIDKSDLSKDLWSAMEFATRSKNTEMVEERYSKPQGSYKDVEELGAEYNQHTVNRCTDTFVPDLSQDEAIELIPAKIVIETIETEDSEPKNCQNPSEASGIVQEDGSSSLAESVQSLREVMLTLVSILNSQKLTALTTDGLVSTLVQQKEVSADTQLSLIKEEMRLLQKKQSILQKSLAATVSQVK